MSSSMDVIFQKALPASIAAIPLSAVFGSAVSFNLFYLIAMRTFECFKYHAAKLRILHFKATTLLIYFKPAHFSAT